MRTVLVFLFMTFISVIICTSLLGQDTDAIQDSILHEKFYGNRDYQQGANLKDKGQTVEARPFLLSAMKAFQLEKKWKAFGLSVGELVYTYIGAQNYQEGLDIGNSACLILEQQKKALAVYKQDIVHSMGIIYDVSGNIGKAKEFFEQELAINEDYYKIDTTYHFGVVYNSLAIVQAKYGDLDRALHYFNKSKASYLSATDCDDCKKSKIADTYGNIGIVHKMKGNIEMAIETAKLGVELEETINGPNSILLISRYTNIGNFYNDLLEYSIAEKYYLKAENIIKDLASIDEIRLKELIIVKINLASSYILQKRDKEAVFYINWLTKVYQEDKIHGEEVLNYLSVYSDFEKMKKNHLKALEILTEAEEIWYKDIYNNEDIHKGYSIGFNLLSKKAIIFQELNSSPKAKEYLHKTLAFIEKRNRIKEAQVASFYHDLSQIFLEEERLDSALYYNHHGLISLCKDFNSSNYSALPLLSDFTGNANTYQILQQRAIIRQKEAKRYDNKNQKTATLNSSLAFIDLADEFHLGNLKKTSVLRSSQNSKIIGKSEPVYELGISLAAQLYKLNHDKNNLNRAFYYSQKVKSQTLFLSLLESQAIKKMDIDQSLLKQERDLLSDLNYYENLIYDAKKTNDTTAIDLYQNQYYFKLNKEYQNLISSIEQSNPEYFEAKYDIKPLSADEIKEVLTPEEIVINYSISEIGKTKTLHIFLIQQGKKLNIYNKVLDADFNNQVTNLNTLLKSPYLSRKDKREKFIQSSNQLYRQLITPIENELVNSKKLIIIGDDITHYLPFEVLLKSKEIKPFNELEYLVNDFEISYHYSATLFAKSRKKETQPTEGLLAFAPVFDDEIGASVTMRNSPALDTTYRAVDKDGNYTPLAYSLTEVEEIAKMVKKKSSKNTEVLLFKNANEANLKAKIEKPYRFIHIASHSFANLKESKFSGIACSPPMNSSEKEDGTLYVGEVYNLDIPADLVVLSSCESGLGKLQAGEGLIGLNRSFIYAGVPNVVFSLWKVNDKVSSDLMINFYREMMNGEDYAGALRKAKLSLLKNENTASPNLWSSFLLIGR